MFCVVKWQHNPIGNRMAMKKSAQRDANIARALVVLRFGHRPPVINTHTNRQDRLQYTALLASAQCNNGDNWEVLFFSNSCLQRFSAILLHQSFVQSGEPDLWSF